MLERFIARQPIFDQRMKVIDSLLVAKIANGMNGHCRARAARKANAAARRVVSTSLRHAESVR